ncbi:MAG: P-loop NTPase family protein [Planctomycetota bacterium]|jgi:recombination protein RecA
MSTAVRKGLRAGISEWSIAGFAGRLVELSGAEGSAAMTMAFALVREAQLLGEPAAWVSLEKEGFFPPDVAAGGVDLDALAVVRVPATKKLARAADMLARSGAFGLVVIDVGQARVAMAVLARLLGLAQKHKTAIVFLTRKPEQTPSLGSLVSLRGQAVRRQSGRDEFVCSLTVVKDKRRAPGWGHEETCHGPAGLH